MFQVPRKDVEDCNPEMMLHGVRVADDNPIIQAGPGTVLFGVEGYDDDPRELWQIPEFIRFAKKMEEHTPCWLYFAAPGSGWSLLILNACDPKPALVQKSDGSGYLRGHLNTAIDAFLESQVDDFMELCGIAGLSKSAMVAAWSRAVAPFGRG